MTKYNRVPLGDFVRTWARVAGLSFGGPVGQIAVMHRILVDEKRWVGESRFLHALNCCMILPGPEAQQMATYIGWLLRGPVGGLIAGGLFILPGFIAIMALSWIYALHGGAGPVQALFVGLKAAVLAVVVDAVIRIGRRALTGWWKRALAAAAFAGLFVYDLPFPLIVAAAGLVGLGLAWMGARGIGNGLGHGHGGAAGGLADADSLIGADTPDHAKPSHAWTRRVLLVGLPLWLVPVAGLVLALGPQNVFAAVAVFFSKMAVVTFGGAYAVLAYVAQQAVEHYGWLQPGEMLDGLGMAETTPGPLIMVLQFVGFMAGFRDPGGLPPLWAATLAACLATWVTFVPCFLWIFLGGPYAEALRHSRALWGALSAITAAVVGVVLNLALWFALHTLFARLDPVAVLGGRVDVPDPASVNGQAAVLTAVALVLTFGFRLGTVPMLAVCAGLGMAWHGVAG